MSKLTNAIADAARLVANEVNNGADELIDGIRLTLRRLPTAVRSQVEDELVQVFGADLWWRLRDLVALDRGDLEAVLEDIFADFETADEAKPAVPK